MNAASDKFTCASFSTSEKNRQCRDQQHQTAGNQQQDFNATAPLWGFVFRRVRGRIHFRSSSNLGCMMICRIEMGKIFSPLACHRVFR